jgi:hypothetical protein
VVITLIAGLMSRAMNAIWRASCSVTAWDDYASPPYSPLVPPQNSLTSGPLMNAEELITILLQHLFPARFFHTGPLGQPSGFLSWLKRSLNQRR